MNQDSGHSEDGPSAKIIQVGVGCNNHCVTCKSCSKDFGSFDTKINEITNKNNSEQIIFTGSEPAIQSGFLKAVKLARDLEYKSIQVISNGRIFASKDFTIKVLKAGLSEVLIKFPSHKREVFETITRTPGSYNQTVRGIKNLKVIGQQLGSLFEPIVVCGVYVTEDNEKGIKETLKFLEKLGVDEIFLINTSEPREISIPLSKLPVFTLGFKSDNRYEDYIKNGVLVPEYHKATGF